MNGLIFSILAAVLGIIIVSLVIPPLIKIAHLKKLFEPIDSRKAHNNIVPTIGGVSIFISIILSSFLASDGYGMYETKYLYPAIVVMFFIGLKDDIVNLSPRKKFIAQVGAAILLTTLGQFRLHSLYGVFGIWEINVYIDIILSTILIIAFINAFNFIDGVDGLASSVSIIASLVYGIVFILLERYELSILSFAITGSMAAFFYFNVFGKKHKLFMGDTGSLIIGVLLGALSLKFIEYSSEGLSLIGTKAPAIAMAITIIPVTDIIRIFTIRILKGKSPFSPDKNHIHHKLLRIFPVHFKTTMILTFANLIFIVLAFFLINTNLNINYIIGIILILALLTAYLPFKLRSEANYNN